MDYTFVAVILLAISQPLSLLALAWVVNRQIEAKQAELTSRAEELLRAWVTPGSDGKPSQFATVLDAGGSVIGAAAARSIMAALGADKSHAARAANGLADELQGAQNPLMGLLAGGKRGKGAAIARLAEMIAPMLSKGNGSGGSAAPEEYKGRRHF